MGAAGRAPPPSPEEKAAGPLCLALADSAVRLQDRSGNDPEPRAVTAMHHHSPCTKPGNPELLSLSSECLVYSRDLELKCFLEASRKRDWVKSARRELSYAWRAHPGSGERATLAALSSTGALSEKEGPRVTLKIAGLAKRR